MDNSLASENAIKLDSKLVMAWGNKGHALAGLGRTDEAIHMTCFDMPLQSPRDRISWILNSHGGSIELGRLRGETGIRYAILTPMIPC